MDEHLIEELPDPSEYVSPGGSVARGDDLDDGEEAALPSQLDGVSDECWTQFVKRMMTAKLSHVSASNAVGLFEIMPRRLEDLGLVRKLQRSRSPEGRVVYVAVFVQPLTSQRFLRSPQIQYRTFCASMKKYDEQMQKGEIKRDPQMSRSGALAILHRCGPQGLEQKSELFENTKRVYERVAGLF